MTSPTTLTNNKNITLENYVYDIETKKAMDT